MKPKKKIRETVDCHDCNASEGEFHQEGCDMERCIDCGGQLISCECENKKYGQIPYLVIPNLCRLCGEQWPELFNDDDWGYYVVPELQEEVVCMSCFEEIKKIFPQGWKKE